MEFTATLLDSGRVINGEFWGAAWDMIGVAEKTC
jgi:hypothetical protein